MSYPRELTSPTAQAGAPDIVNENGAAIAALALYARNYVTSTGLTLGYYGGHLQSTVVADGTIALDASNTVYVVAHRTTGVVTKATNTTNWNLTTTYGRLFKCTTSASVITAYEDWRSQLGGIFDHGATSGSVATDTIWDAAGDLAVGTGADTAARLAKGTALQVLRVNAGATALEWATAAAGDALTTNPLSQFAATTSAQLAGVISDETGSGALVFGTSPTLVTPALGTPSALVLTNATGLPVAGGGTGVATLTAYAPIFGGTTGTGAVQSGAVGTSGHVLTSNGAGALPTFQAAASGSVATDTIWDAKGDLAGGTGANTAARLAVGTNGHVLTADSAEAAGMKWAAGSGSTQGRHDIPIAPGSWYADQTAPPLWAGENGATDQPDFAGWSFDPTTEQAVWTVVQFPKKWNAGTITYDLTWSRSGGSNPTVVWSLRAVSMGDGDLQAANYGTAQAVTDTATNSATIYRTPESSALTIAGTPQDHDLIFLELRRKPGDASDTYDAGADLEMVTLHITTDADTDA